MSAFWVNFRGHAPMCVEHKDLRSARMRAEVLAPVTKIERLPYPAEPRLAPCETFKDDHGLSWPVPAFCYDPKHCVGFTSCPKRLACSE